MTDVDLGIDLESLLDDPDPEECAHIVRRQGDLSAAVLIAYAAEHGLPVRALCGFEWVPRGFAPDDLPPCRPCVKAWEAITGGTA